MPATNFRPAYRNEPLEMFRACFAALPEAETARQTANRRIRCQSPLPGKTREEGEVDALVKGKTAELELQSGFGGKVTVQLSAAREPAALEVDQVGR